MSDIVQNLTKYRLTKTKLYTADDTISDFKECLKNEKFKENAMDWCHDSKYLDIFWKSLTLPARSDFLIINAYKDIIPDEFFYDKLKLMYTAFDRYFSAKKLFITRKFPYKYLDEFLPSSNWSESIIKYQTIPTAAAVKHWKYINENLRKILVEKNCLLKVLALEEDRKLHKLFRTLEEDD